MKYKDILIKGITILAQLKAMHWQTSNNAHHEIFDQLSTDFGKQNDQLMEIIMGNLGKRIGVGGGIIHIVNINDIDPLQFIGGSAQFYQQVINFMNDESKNGMVNESSLNDILYDIVNLFKKNLYLLRQK